MFCQNCGTKNEEDAVFCESCGAKLEHDTVVVQENVQERPYGSGRKGSKLGRILLIEAVLFMVAGYALIMAGKGAFTAEQTAGRFFVYMVNGNWDEAYKLLDADESEFINAKMFARANEGGGLGAVSNYQIAEEGLQGDTLSAALGKTVAIEYRMKGAASNCTYEVTLNRQADKKYGLFDDWKIGTDDFIYADYQIVVPRGASVVLDDIALDSGYEKNGQGGYGTEMSCYVIPQIFLGSHTITVSMKDKEDVAEHFYVDAYSDTYQVGSMRWKEEVLETLSKTAVEYITRIYSAVLSGEDYSSVSGLFLSQADQAENCHRSYEDLTEYFGCDYPERFQILNIRFYDVNASAWPEEAQIELTVTYDMDYLWPDWWRGQMKQESYRGGEHTFLCNFTQENGNWVLTEFPDLELYF